MLDELAGQLAEIGNEMWQRDAICIEYYPKVDWFFERGESTNDAKAVCARCLVREECLDYALRNDIPDGVWGGLSQNQRRGLQRMEQKPGRPRKRADAGRQRTPVPVADGRAAQPAPAQPGRPTIAVAEPWHYKRDAW